MPPGRPVRSFLRAARRVPWWVWLAGLAIGAQRVLRDDRALHVDAPSVLIVTAVLVWRGWVRLRRPRIRNWRDAEHAAARWLRHAGCRRVVLTTESADGGIDVVTADWAVQVKHTAKRVGRPAVQQLVGAALSIDRRAALFSTSGFTAPAMAYADEHDVALFELDVNGSARGVNRSARRVGRRSRRLLPGRN